MFVQLNSRDKEIVNLTKIASLEVKGGDLYMILEGSRVTLPYTSKQQCIEDYNKIITILSDGNLLVKL